MVYALMRERLPQTAIVSVGHRSTLKALHNRSIDVAQLHACEAVPSANEECFDRSRTDAFLPAVA